MPPERRPQIELVPVLALRHPMQAFVEVDVSTTRLALARRRERTGERLSFTAFLIGCLAQAVALHPQVQAFRRGGRLVVFPAVDVATLVEVNADGTPVPIPYVIRDVAARSLQEIHREIRAVQADPAPHLDRMRRQVAITRWVPRPLRWLLWRGLARSPDLRRRFGGTAVVTSVGMFGPGRAWGSTLASYPVTVLVGGISTRTEWGDGQPVVREFLCLTVTLDHEVIDGAPAARFIATLRQLIEQGHDIVDDG